MALKTTPSTTSFSLKNIKYLPKRFLAVLTERCPGWRFNQEEPSEPPCLMNHCHRCSAKLTDSYTHADFVIPPDDVPEDIRRAVKHWSQWIGYWAVDWDNQGDTFHNQWQTFRTRQDGKLDLTTAYTYAEAGEYRIVVKVIDILGNDTTKTVKVKCY